MTRFPSLSTNIFCLPFARRRRRAALDRSQPAATPAPERLPEPLLREKALTIDVSADAQNDYGRANPQPHSGLIGLPREIRDQIWIDVLGGKELCILLLKGRFHLTNKHKDTQPGLLSLSLTCRLIYAETITVLYQYNAFSLRTIDTLLCFRDSILHERVIKIQHLVFVWHVSKRSSRGSAEAETWTRLWEEVAKYGRLKTVWVEIRTEGEWSVDQKAKESELLLRRAHGVPPMMNMEADIDLFWRLGPGLEASPSLDS
ncbi:hypothetical protein VTL71DRAFT_6128 [Oculimacula yallundae]|uniref:DUF7730 domain-containing protein n=1 Tax=Oculimacula yallundae TaxID=86028 RepID=A0ABR4BZG7_9HELO